MVALKHKTRIDPDTLHLRTEVAGMLIVESCRTVIQVPSRGLVLYVKVSEAPAEYGVSSLLDALPWF